MRIRLLIAALAVSFCFAPANAQTPQQQENLKNLLNKKFGTKTRGIGGDGDQQLKPDDYYWVKPDGSVQKAPAAPSVPPKRSSVDDPGAYTAMLSAAWNWVTSFFGPRKETKQPTTAANPPAETATVPAPPPAANAPPPADGPAAAGPTQKEEPVMHFAQAGAGEPVAVKRNSYIIQLKPDVTDAQIDALLTKYNLEVTHSDAELGWLYVRQKESKTRSIAPGQDPATLGQLLRPRIIKDLRREPGVDAAFVNSGVKPNAVPSPVKTQSELGGVTYRWYWRTGTTDDGNWGLKAMRMPPVWTILERHRKLHPETKSVNVAVVDSGFGKHSDLTYGSVSGGMPQAPFLATCTYSHGTHVAGIVAAGFGNNVGTDGMLPNAKVNAVPIGQDEPPPLTGANDPALMKPQPDSLFANVIQDTSIFLGSNLSDANSRGVVNVSLGFNWYAIGALKDKLPYEDEDIKDHVEDLGAAVRRLAYKFRSRVLFVSAAGNDSGLLNAPLEARWATPFGWAATASTDNTQPSDNILVVEATDRDGTRAAFSNIGGQVAAPGVNIMSTLAARQEGYGLCSGTSQAAPHVAALAAILFELAPEKTPAEIANVIKETAITPAVAPSPAPAAPVVETAAKAPAAPETSSEYAMPPLGTSTEVPASAAAQSTSQEPVREVDALDAVLKISPDSIRYLADMNVDGKVDIADLEIVKRDLSDLESAKATGKPIGRDLNGDGVTDNDENCWPLIDFNGSGKASYDGDKDGRMVEGRRMSDLDVVETAWTDKSKDFKTAMKETGLEALIAEWRNGAALIATATGTTRPKVPCE